MVYSNEINNRYKRLSVNYSYLNLSLYIYNFSLKGKKVQYILFIIMKYIRNDKNW